MKELLPEEVLQIAGGRPLTSALDEVTYSAADTTVDPIDRPHLLGSAPAPTQSD